MTKWNLPPTAKVYEALSAVADGRVRVTGETTAEVISSARDKTYSVRWSSDFREITSNDNATRWQGYVGYPIIAVLLHSGRLRYDPKIAATLAAVPWHELNQQYKRDYDKAIDHVLERVRVTGGDIEAVRADAGRILKDLEALELERPAAKNAKG